MKKQLLRTIAVLTALTIIFTGFSATAESEDEMAKTTDRFSIEGEDYLLVDSDARSAIDELHGAISIEVSGTIEGEAGNYKYLRYDDGKIYPYLYESYVFIFSVDGISSFEYLFTTSPSIIGLAFYNSSNQFISGSGVQAIASKQTITVPSGAVTCKATVMSENDISVAFSAGTVMESIGNIENDMNAITTATASDEGKALKAKTVTNGKVAEWEFGEEGGQIVIDDTLTQTGEAADAKVTGDRIAAVKGSVDALIGIDGTITGSAGAYKFLRYDDGKTYDYANPSYVYEFTLGSITSFKYKFTVSSTGLMGLAFYNSAGQFISGSGIQANTTEQTITVPATAVTCKATVLSAADVAVTDTIQDLIEDIAGVDAGMVATVHTDYSGLTPTTGYYVDYRDGKVIVNANMQYVQFPVNVGSYIQYNAKTASPDIRGIAFYNAYGTFLAGYKMLSTAQKLAIPAGTTLCKATVNSVDDVYLILTPDDIARFAEDKETFDILSAFENITCVGDSLTWSQVYLSGGTTRKAHRPWVETLGERTGATTEEIANPGYTASQWWTAHESDIAEKTNQLAIIYLGTNLGLSDTLDTDCVGDDPDEWGSTLTADYCRIIDAFKTAGAQVILVKPFMTTGNTSAGTDCVSTHVAIDHIATRFGCGVVEPIYLADSAYHKYPDGVGTNKVHYNDLGYAAFTDKLITAIAHMSNDYMVNVVPS